jgi:hypothetical protein
MRMATTSAALVAVAPVRRWSDLRAFIDLPFRLHAGTPWIPPLKLERWFFLNRRLNPFFKHGRGQLFLARRDGRVVGRISAQVDTAFNEFHSSRWGMFGFIEFEDDPAVLQALLETADAWLREQGCDRMVGPMDFTMSEESGLLVEGHELEPLIRQPWHPPYYQERLEEAGMEKAMDLLSWHLSLADKGKMSKLLFDVAERARSENSVTIREMTRRGLRKDLDIFADVYNSAWSRNWGFVPYGKGDLDTLALDLQIVRSPGWFMVAEQDGVPIGAAITTMDINQVLKKMRGKLLPLGWWYLLRRHKIVDRLRVGFLGVKPEFQQSGAGAALYVAHFENAARSTLQHGEAGWILETNRSMNRGLRLMNGRIVKRYRVYERLFEGS